MRGWGDLGGAPAGIGAAAARTAPGLGWRGFAAPARDGPAPRRDAGALPVRRRPGSRRWPAAPSPAATGHRVLGAAGQYEYPELPPSELPESPVDGGATGFGVPVGTQVRFFLPFGSITNQVPPTPWPFHWPGFLSPM